MIEEGEAGKGTEPVEAGLLGGAALDFFASATDLVGIVERAEPYRLLYLNAAAERYATGPIGDMIGRPLSEAFRRAAAGPLLGIVRKAAGGEAQSLHGIETRPGVFWNIDAVPRGDVILTVGRPLDSGAASRQRLERLLASTDHIWQNADRDSLATAIVRAAGDVLPDTPCSLSVLRGAADAELEIVGGNEDWLHVGTKVPLTGSQAGAAIASGRPVEGPARDADHPGALDVAGIRHMRVVPLLPSEPLPDGRSAMGVLSFMTAAADGFAEEERRLMDELGKRASVALDRAELIERERQKSERHLVAFDAAMALSASLSPQEVVDELLQQVVKLADADRATLSTLADGQVRVEATYSRRGDSSTWIGRSYSFDYFQSQPLVLRAIETRRAVTGGRLDAGAAAPEFRTGLEQAQQTATIPLVRADAVAGLLVLSRFSGAPFTEEDLATLNLIGHAAMLSLHNARLHAEAIESRNHAEVLARSLEAGTDTALELVQQLELSDVVARLLKRALDLGEADRAVLLAVDGEEALVVQSLSRTGDQPIQPPGRLRISEQPLLVGALATATAQQTGQIVLEALDDQYRDQLLRLKRFATVPLQLGAEATGFLNLSRYRDEAFSEEQLKALTLLGQVAALAIRNTRLFDELRAASTAKTEFLNMAAHELRTPISVLRGYLSLLMDGALGEPPRDWSQPLSVLADKVGDLSNIAEELLLAARVQSGSIGGKRELFDLMGVVRGTVEGAEPAAQLAGGAVRLQDPPRIPLFVAADRNQVRRILDNLLVNAITYSSSAPEVVVVVRRRGGAAVVSVADHGRGIPPDKWEAIFEQFVRVEDADDALRPGTGLGLYVSRGFARANGGEVRIVSSELGTGSEFELELPLTAPPHE